MTGQLFTVGVKGNWDIPTSFTGNASEVTDWLMEKSDVSSYEIYETPAGNYHSVAAFLQKYVVSFAPKFYKMNPETEDVLLTGRKLKNGMRVLIGTSDKRINTSSVELEEWELDKALENNRWCTVGAVEVDSHSVAFIAVYDDGSKRARRFDLHHSWLVKIDSIRETAERHNALTGLLVTVMSDAININNSDRSTKSKELELGKKVVEAAKKIQELQ